MNIKDFVIEDIISAEIVFKDTENMDVTDAVVDNLVEIGVYKKKEGKLVSDKNDI